MKMNLDKRCPLFEERLIPEGRLLEDIRQENPPKNL